MRQRQSISGMGLLLAMMIVMVLVFRITGNMGEETPTQQDYIHAVQEKQVASAIIRPNKETPTGELALTMKDGRQWVVYVADVKEEQKFLMDQGVACIMGNVPQESYLLTMIVPPSLRRGAGGGVHDDERQDNRRRRQRQDDEFWQKSGKAKQGCQQIQF